MPKKIEKKVTGGVKIISAPGTSVNSEERKQKKKKKKEGKEKPRGVQTDRRAGNKAKEK